MVLCADLERWPSGRRRSPAKGVWGLNPIEGSNPSLSAKIKCPRKRVFYFDGHKVIEPKQRVRQKWQFVAIFNEHVVRGA